MSLHLDLAAVFKFSLSQFRYSTFINCRKAKIISYTTFFAPLKAMTCEKSPTSVCGVMLIQKSFFTFGSVDS